MKPKHIVALVAVLVALGVVTVVAAEKRDTKAGDAVYRLKSHGQMIAEIRVVAPAKMEVSHFTMEVGHGHTVWRASDSSRTVTARLLLEQGQPVEFTAEEIELDRELNIGPMGNDR